jgi:hypothetical protein
LGGLCLFIFLLNINVYIKIYVPAAILIERKRLEKEEETKRESLFFFRRMRNSVPPPLLAVPQIYREKKV